MSRLDGTQLERPKFKSLTLQDLKVQTKQKARVLDFVKEVILTNLYSLSAT